MTAIDESRLPTTLGEDRTIGLAHQVRWHWYQTELAQALVRVDLRQDPLLLQDSPGTRARSLALETMREAMMA